MFGPNFSYLIFEVVSIWGFWGQSTDVKPLFSFIMTKHGDIIIPFFIPMTKKNHDHMFCSCQAQEFLCDGVKSILKEHSYTYVIAFSQLMYSDTEKPWLAIN